VIDARESDTAKARETFGRSWIALYVIAIATISGCGTAPPPPIVVTWVVGQSSPPFDPQGPPDVVRWSIERMLSRGLVEETPDGRLIPAAAESIHVSDDQRTYTFRLRPSLAFGDGQVCDSRYFARALRAGFNRLDHSTYAWLLSAVTGMDRVRAGRPLPELGIETPDGRTLVLRLARPDTSLLRKLALPGVAVPWKEQAGHARWGDGIGGYRVVGSDEARMTLARRRDRPDLPDTVTIRFVPVVARLRAMLRAGEPDLVWPLPPDLLDQPLPPEYRSGSAPARPARHLSLVLRADLPPTSHNAARQAFAYGLHIPDLLIELGSAGERADVWWAGGEGHDLPARDPDAVQSWLERGHLGRSLHGVMVYSADGAGARVARAMQAQWAQSGLDVELRPVRQPRVGAEWLRRGGAQLLLVECPTPLDDPIFDLATLVDPMRGPALGGFRTGWRTRELERWMHASADRPMEVATIQQRLSEERVVIPLARLPWLWAERTTRQSPIHPRYGPQIVRPVVEGNRR